ncbi:MAG: hypothetical protein Q9181_005875 [Wetmoreana brouardii]
MLQAAESGQVRRLELLIQASADLDHKDSLGDTALHKTSSNTCAELLLHHGADVMAQNNAGYTSLLLAVERRNYPLFELMVHHVATNAAALEYFFLERDATALSFFIEKGVNVNARDEHRLTALLHVTDSHYNQAVRLLLKHGADVDARNAEGRTPLLFAASTACEYDMRMLLEAGADIEAKKYYEELTPLLYAINSGYHSIQSGIKFLITRSSNVEVKTKDGDTPLIIASRREFDDVVKGLLDRGARIERRNQSRYTALMEAAFFARETVVDLLCKRGADVEARGNRKQTPLHRAAHNDTPETIGCIQLLLAHNANIEAKADNTVTALQIAVFAGNIKTVRYLLDKGADIEGTVGRGVTPLHQAACRGNEAIVSLLCERGARTWVKTHEGGTALGWAKEEGHHKCAEIIRAFQKKERTRYSRRWKWHR